MGPACCWSPTAAAFLRRGGGVEHGRATRTVPLIRTSEGARAGSGGRAQHGSAAAARTGRIWALRVRCGGGGWLAAEELMWRAPVGRERPLG